jgi:hypothetical protein
VKLPAALFDPGKRAPSVLNGGRRGSVWSQTIFNVHNGKAHIQEGLKRVVIRGPVISPPAASMKIEEDGMFHPPVGLFVDIEQGVVPADGQIRNIHVRNRTDTRLGDRRSDAGIQIGRRRD